MVAFKAMAVAFTLVVGDAFCGICGGLASVPTVSPIVNEQLSIASIEQ